ncbi:MAG: peptidoglycan-binding protein, partial [Marivita lacus]|nr:peptidoglycan-binding protein [Marivita lacus]
MVRNFLISVVAILMLWGQGASAQESVYVQIEAQPSLSVAEDRLRDYASILPDVNGFDLGRGWYGIALGPYPRNEANDVLRSLRAQRLIPSDSYLEEPGRYGQRIWPIGAGPATLPPVTAPQIAAAPEPETPVTDETPREARASEALLTRQEREALQIALRWAGVYNAGIDGAFGQGTRRAMADWQAANGYEVTGILTTAQWADLFRQYNA